jgi:hypothetical protein
MPIPPSEHPDNQPAPDERQKGQTQGYDDSSLEDKAPNEHFTESGEDNMLVPRSHECPECFQQGRRVEGELVESYEQERTHQQKYQEVAVRKCPECGLLFSDI